MYSCHYWYFNHEFKFQNSVCNGCNDLKMLCIKVSDIVILTVKGVAYGCTIHDINKSDAINLLESYVLGDRGHIKNAFQKNQYSK